MSKSKLSPNMEMYLKTIQRLGDNGSAVRVKAIAESLGVTMPSVSEALRTLKANGFVDHASYGEVSLSEEGRRVATSVDQRFVLLRKFLSEMLRVDEATADREACEIEHVIGEVTLTRLASFVEWMTVHRADIEDCLTKYHQYLELLLGGEFDRAKTLLFDGVGEATGKQETDG